MYGCARNKCGGIWICGMAMTGEMEHVLINNSCFTFLIYFLKKKKKKRRKKKKRKKRRRNEVMEEIAFDITNCPCS